MPVVAQGDLDRIVPATYYIDILNGLYLRNLVLDRALADFLVLAVMACCWRLSTSRP